MQLTEAEKVARADTRNFVESVLEAALVVPHESRLAAVCGAKTALARELMQFFWQRVDVWEDKLNASIPS